ncbi:MAG: LysR substrate-binding domain-containing protein [Gammaproteobacteria bacterium]|jgi:LysR family cys regulon transcriptional activator|nr:LysR substrate-binding domain-containing protein [Gammaproteobacteria bacterium]|tara:strand:- start:358 stop:1359 length:1002 start_codon:yes stop_codon:yes gene_type:complete
MTLTQFKYLLSIVDNKLNITKAAESSNTSQPGISKQIKLLEDELGAFIFARKGKKITALTSFGEEVVWYAKKILQDVDNIKLLSDQISDVDEGVLTLATTSAQARYILPEVIQVFKDDFPKVKLELKLGSSEQIREMVIKNEVDLAIATDLEGVSGDLVLLPAYHWFNAIIAPLDHPIKKDLKKLTIRRLAKEPLVTYAFSVGPDTSFTETFNKKNLIPNIVFAARDADIIKTYVKMGMGIGVISGMAYECDDHEDFIAVSGENIFPKCTTYFGFRRGMILSRYAISFINLFAEHLNPKLIMKAAEAKTQDGVNQLFSKIELPVKGGCDQIKL